MAKIVMNVRTLGIQATGVQRYTREVVSRLAHEVDQISPRRPLHGVSGHVWEQAVLPLKLSDRLLWSPAGTGPWLVSRQVVTIHDLAALDHPEWFGSRFARWYRFLQPRLLATAERIITVSEFSRQRAAAYVPAAEERIVVIPLGIGAAFRPVEKDQVADVRRRLRLPDSYVLVVGSLQPRKNLRRLLAAWRRIEDRIPSDVVLAISGMRFDHLFGDPDLSPTPTRVRLLGYVDDVDLPALYTGALVFVYPSLYEGFGLPPLEAMACGTAVVSANAGSLPEVVGDAAVLVEPREIDSIAEGLVRALEEEPLRTRLHAAGLARAKEFTWERTAEATRRVLRLL